MITTGCDGCCFLKQDDQGKGCAAQQLCAQEDGKIFAPGYCRTCRSDKWADKQGTTDYTELYDKVVGERALKFDLLIFFDEATHTIKDLERTLDSDWYTKYAKKIIIMDIAGFGERKNLALQYMRTHKHTVETVVDSTVVKETSDQREDTIRRVSKQVTSTFFLVIGAGDKLNNFDLFAKMIQYMPSRVINWSFPYQVGWTTLITQQLTNGLFITAPYRALMKQISTESFTERLRKEEIETKMGLSWLCDVVYDMDRWLPK